MRFHCPNGQVVLRMRTWEGTLFTAAFSVSFIVTIFVPDIEVVQKKVICLWIGTTCSVNVARTCSADLYDIYREFSERTSTLKQLRAPKWKYGPACCIFSISCRFSILWYVDCKFSTSCICIHSRFFKVFYQRKLSRVPRIREIGSLQVHTGYLTFSLKKTDIE